MNKSSKLCVLSSFQLVKILLRSPDIDVGLVPTGTEPALAGAARLASRRGDADILKLLIEYDRRRRAGDSGVVGSSAALAAVLQEDECNVKLIGIIADAMWSKEQ